MKVVFTAEAQDDLDEIRLFIAADNPTRATSFLNELLDRCERLRDSPEGFQFVPRYEHLGVRRRPYRNYLIFYRVRGERIEVLHILHGARDYESLLFPDE